MPDRGVEPGSSRECCGGSNGTENGSEPMYPLSSLDDEAGFVVKHRLYYKRKIKVHSFVVVIVETVL